MQSFYRKHVLLKGLILGMMLVVQVEMVPSKSQVETDVLILGAGAAGLAAAKTLSDNNIHDFIMVEGSGRIGGRVKSVKFAGKTVEAGANWIIGMDDNPLYDIAQRSHIGGKVSDWDSVIIRTSDGEDVTDSEGEDAWSKLEDAQNISINAAARTEDGEYDMSVRSCLDIGKWQPKTPVEKVVEIYDYDFEYGYLPDVSSCFEVVKNTPLKEEAFYVNDERGYEFLLHKYIGDVLTHNDPRLYLNEAVTDIKYGKSRVKVETNQGSIFTAKYVIVTFSIGVLKSATVTFHPRLPDWKIDSLFRIRLESYFGIYLKFPDTLSRFWDDTEFTLFADERRGYYPVLLNPEADGLWPSGTNIIEVVVFGEEADRVSQPTEEQITMEIMEMLRRVYKDPQISDPEDMFFNNWRNDSLYLGSFCNLEPGSVSAEIFRHISAPVGRLYFAGEAYARTQACYVLGALRSGVTTALEVGQNFK